MLRPNGDSGKVRKSDFVSLPYRPIGSTKTWGSTGYVFAVFDGGSGHTYSGWKKQSGFKDLFRRRAVSALAVLGAFFGFYKVCDQTSARNITSVNC